MPTLRNNNKNVNNYEFLIIFIQKIESLTELTLFSLSAMTSSMLSHLSSVKICVYCRGTVTSAKAFRNWSRGQKIEGGGVRRTEREV